MPPFESVASGNWTKIVCGLASSEMKTRPDEILRQRLELDQELDDIACREQEERKMEERPSLLRG